MNEQLRPKIKNNNNYLYDSLNRLETVNEKDSHYRVEENLDVKMGEAFKDFEGDKNAELILSGDEEIKLDHGAKSVVTDLGGVFEINKVFLSPNDSVNRVTAGDVSLYAKSDGDWQKVSDVKIKKDMKDGSITILCGSYVKARYVKINCRLDDRTIDNQIEDKFCSFKNTGRKLIKIYAHRTYLNENYGYDENSSRTALVRNGVKYNLEYYKNDAGKNTAMLKDDGRYTYTYDANGNRISKRAKTTDEKWTYSWDIYNRLVKVENNKGVCVSYEYDAENYKTSRVSGNEKTSYAYSQNGFLLWEKTINNESEAKTERRYIYHGTDLIGFEENGEKYFTMTDYKGSVVQITDKDGQKVWIGNYDPYGRLCGREGSFDFTGMYAGKEIDNETGLTYHWNRWRNEDGDSFISEDPAEDGHNWYAYANCNPFKFRDNTGLAVTKDGQFNGGAKIPGTNQPWGTGGPSWASYGRENINHYTTEAKRANDIEQAKLGNERRNRAMQAFIENLSIYKFEVDQVLKSELATPSLKQPVKTVEDQIRYISVTCDDGTTANAAIFNQNMWTIKNGFKPDFAGNACAATAVLNGVSIQYTKENGVALTFKSAKKALLNVIESTEDILDGNFGYVGNWTGLANSLGSDFKLMGRFIDDEVMSADYAFYAFSTFEDPDNYKHFSLILDITTHKFIDSWDGKIKYWARDNFGGGIPGAEYRVCPLQTYRKYRGMNYVKE